LALGFAPHPPPPPFGPGPATQFGFRSDPPGAGGPGGGGGGEGPCRTQGVDLGKAQMGPGGLAARRPPFPGGPPPLGEGGGPVGRGLRHHLRPSTAGITIGRGRVQRRLNRGSQQRSSPVISSSRGLFNVINPYVSGNGSCRNRSDGPFIRRDVRAHGQHEIQRQPSPSSGAPGRETGGPTADPIAEAADDRPLAPGTNARGTSRCRGSG